MDSRLPLVDIRGVDLHPFEFLRFRFYQFYRDGCPHGSDQENAWIRLLCQSVRFIPSSFDLLIRIVSSFLLTFFRYFSFFSFSYNWVYSHYRLTGEMFEEPNILAWWFMFVAVDFCYYWVHRTGHTVRALWSCHSIHHSSEFYNLTTALRQSTFHGWVNWIYYIPLALFFPPTLFLYHSQFNLLYQFWIHTETIPKLGFLEYFLNTPSQHRVHHGRGIWAIDKNYGGTLCIFDRLFGTFQEEPDDEPVVYGLV